MFDRLDNILWSQTNFDPVDLLGCCCDGYTKNQLQQKIYRHTVSAETRLFRLSIDRSQSEIRIVSLAAAAVYRPRANTPVVTSEKKKKQYKSFIVPAREGKLRFYTLHKGSPL